MLQKPQEPNKYIRGQQSFMKVCISIVAGANSILLMLINSVFFTEVHFF